MTPTSEEWRPVLGYEGLYEVSDHGRVRSLDHTVLDRTGRLNRFRGRILRPRINRGNGRRMLHLSKNGVPHLTTIYPLVLEAFVGARPRGMEACHNNGDCLDDRLSNLRWDTPSENVRDVVRHGRHRQALRQDCPYGHRLAPPNLTPSGNGRKCLACSRARANVRHAKARGYAPIDHQSQSDWHYARIVQRPKE